MHREPSGNRVQSVDRALALLEALAEVGNAAGLVELSERVDLDASTAHRLLQTLQARGFVRQEEGTRRYSLGLRAFEVGNAVDFVNELRHASRPVLETLAERSQETTNMVIRSGWKASIIEYWPGQHFLRVQAEVGRVMPLHATASGKVLLAACAPDEIEAFLRQGRLAALTPRTVTSPDEIRQDQQWVRAHGYAVDDEEFETGVRCVAAPVRNRDGRVVAAVSISGPTVRMQSGELNQYIQMVRRAGADISRNLGYEEAPAPVF
ncbi:MAG: IclR family transcriptional regulator [Bacillota bacterium]